MSSSLIPMLAALSLAAAACGNGVSVAPPELAEAASSTTAVPTTTARVVTTTSVPELAPPTTRGVPTEVEVDPITSTGSMVVLAGEPPYRGVLGRIDRDRNIVAPVALPPAPASPGIAPLTGLPLDDVTSAGAPALMAKIDNTSKGRPQAGIMQADLIYEEMIEGGFTRLAVVFHSNVPDLIGPIRSGRTTDIALFGSLGKPVFVWSGANLVQAKLLRRQSMVDLGAATRSEYSRASDRPGTYNLMTNAVEIRSIAERSGSGEAPDPHFEYRNDATGLPSTAVAVDSVTVDYPSVKASWEWDAKVERWLRTQGGTPHVDADGERVSVANVIVAQVRRVATGSTDTAGSTVYEEQFLGSGRGWVFTDGHVIEVTWTKPSIASVATWTTADGVPVAITPGITWVELSPDVPSF